MKKSFVFIPLLITILLIIISIVVLVTGQRDETKIYTATDLIRFFENDAGTAGNKAVICTDIKLEDFFEPVTLACELDGLGHTVSVNDIGIASLFDTVLESGSVKNLVISGKEGGTNLKVTAGITLNNHGTIENCIVNADFSGDEFVSGICHTNNGSITGCFVRAKDGAEYIWHSVCAENYGIVKECYYSDSSGGEADSPGIFVSDKEIKDGALINILNEYSKVRKNSVVWVADENGYPALKADGNTQTAAVAFSGGDWILVLCIIILIIVVPMFTIVYADKQKKKVIYNKKSSN